MEGAVKDADAKSSEDIFHATALASQIWHWRIYIGKKEMPQATKACVQQDL